MEQKDDASINQGKYVQANGLNIYYEEYGSGQPLVLLHGGTVTSQMWQPFISSFIPHFRVITPDSRAHGRTNNPAGELSYHMMADDVIAFTHALNLTKPLVFGYSDGGQIALEIGMRYPGFARALVVGAAWYKFTEKYIRWLKSLGLEGPGVVDTERIQREKPEWVEHWKTEHIQSKDAEFWRKLLKQISVMWWTPLDYSAEDFQKITEPTLILLGDRDDLIEIGQAIEMYQLIPKSELAILPNGTHNSPNPKLLTNTVIDFFLRHTAEVAPEK